MSKIICIKCGEEKNHYAFGLCQGCYRKQRRYSQNKLCEGCEIKKRVTDDAKFGLCKSCIQKAIRGNLFKTIESGSGKELYLKWEKGKWVLVHKPSYEAELIRKDLLARLTIVHRND